VPSQTRPSQHPTLAQMNALSMLAHATQRRALRAMAEEVARAAAGNDPDLASVALDGLASLQSDTTQIRKPKTLRELASEWYESLNRDPNENTVSPGLAPLKRIIGRLDCGSMTLIGADVNVGKSTLALEMLILAMMDEERVGYLSMEDPEKIVTQRIMSSIGGMSPKLVRRFRPGSEGSEKIDRAMRIMHELDDRMQVSGCIGMNERQALEQMSMMAKRGARLIVLDYIGVVGCSVKQQDRRNEIRWIATRFKARATFANVALVVVSQFARPKENDSAKKPTKHSFRESGDLEAMAEYAIVMWRKVEDDYAPVYCEMAKAKTGGVGHGWTMQREIRKSDGSTGSGRLVEVAHDDDDIKDEHGGRAAIREVMADTSGNQRWTKEKSQR
jgi:replicative DNA helicase